MFEKLIRFKHVVIIIVALFIAPLHLFNAFFIEPIIQIGYAKNAAFLLLLVQSIYLAWIAFQSSAVSEGKVRAYFDALPIHPFKKYIVDLIMLIIANNIFLIPVIAVLMKIPLANELAYFKILILMISIFALQMQWIHRKYGSLILVLVTDMLFYMSNTLSHASLSILCLTFSLISAIVFTYPWQLKINSAKQFPIVNLSRKFRLKYSGFQLLKYNYVILLKKYFIECVTRCVLSMAILMFGCIAVIMNESLNSLQWSISMLSLVVLIMSGLFSLLKESREKYKLYFDALPISSLHWHILDYFTVMLLVMIFAFVYFFGLNFFHKLNIIEMANIIISSSFLAVILGYLRNRYRKFNSLFSIITTITWIAIILYR